MHSGHAVIAVQGGHFGLIHIQQILKTLTEKQRNRQAVRANLHPHKAAGYSVHDSQLFLVLTADLLIGVTPVNQNIGIVTQGGQTVKLTLMLLGIINSQKADDPAILHQRHGLQGSNILGLQQFFFLPVLVKSVNRIDGDRAALVKSMQPVGYFIQRHILQPGFFGRHIGSAQFISIVDNLFMVIKLKDVAAVSGKVIQHPVQQHIYSGTGVLLVEQFVGHAFQKLQLLGRFLFLLLGQPLLGDVFIVAVDQYARAGFGYYPHRRTQVGLFGTARQIGKDKIKNLFLAGADLFVQQFV